MSLAWPRRLESEQGSSRTGRFDGGWTVEAAIPFKSLRYRPGRAQIWGLNIIRIVQWKNERSSLTPLPAARGLGAQFLASFSATLVGLEAPVGAPARSSSSPTQSRRSLEHGAEHRSFRTMSPGIWGSM